MNNFKSGLLWGAFFGAIAGLMNAPRSGSETREGLKAYVQQTKQDATELKFKADHLSTVVEQINTVGLKNTQDFVEEIQLDIKHFVENNQPRIRRIKNRLETLQTNLEESMNNLSNTSDN